MLNLAQVNIGVKPFGLIEIKLIALLYIGVAITYLILMIGWLISRKNSLTNSALVIYVVQGIAVPIVILISGIILMIQGWRLDSVMQFQQFSLLLLIIYLSFRDIIFNLILRIR